MTSLRVRATALALLVLSFVLSAAGLARAAEQGVLLRDGDRLTAEITHADEDAFDIDLVEGGALQVAVSASRGSLLRPSVSVFGPDGVEVDVAAGLSGSGTPKVRLKRLAIPVGLSGRWQIRVAGTRGTTGGYEISAQLQVPASAALPTTVIPGGKTAELPFVATPNARVRCSIRMERYSAQPWSAQINDPDGVMVPGSTAAFRLVNGLYAPLIRLGDGLGRYTLVVNPPPEGEMRINARVWVTPDRTAARRVVLTPEATIAAAPRTVRQEDVAVGLQLEGTGLVPGTWIGMDDGVTVRELRLAPDASGADVVVDVSADAHFGAHALVVYPPELDGESQRIENAFTVLAPVPVVSNAILGVARQGDPELVLELEGSGFREGGSITVSGEGVTTGPVSVVSPTRARTTLTIADDAPFGARDVVYTQPVAGGGDSATLTEAVRVNAPVPSLAGAAPAALRQGGPVEFTVVGTGFRAGATVAISGPGLSVGSATVISSTQARVTVSVDDDAAYGPRDVTFTQSLAGGGDSSAVAGATSVVAPMPSIASVAPGSVRQEQTGVTLTVTGTGFRPGGTITVAGAGISLGATTVVDATTATVVLGVAADAAYGARDVTFTQPAAGGGDAAVAAGSLLVTAPVPGLASVTPGMLRQDDASVLMTLTGSRLRSGGTVSVSGGGITISDWTVVNASTATLRVSVASNATFGTRSVTYSQPASGGGDSATLADSVRVNAPVPSVTAGSPAQLRQGGTVEFTVAGTGLRAGGTVAISGAGLSVGATSVLSPTQARVTISVDADAPYGPRSVTFTQPSEGGGDSASSSSATSVLAPLPSIARVEPGSIRQEQTGVVMTVTGMGFRSGGTITVSGAGLSLGATTVVDATTATVVIGAAADAAYGARNVTFTQPAAGGGDAAIAASALLVTAPVPSLSAVTPGTLRQEDSGVLVTLTGTGLRSGGTLSVSGTGITISEWTIVNASTATLRAAVASDATLGTRSVTYAQPAAGGGDSVTLAGALRVNAPVPTVTSASPAQLRQGAASVDVTVTGTRFRTGGTVAISGGGLTVSSTSVLSPTQARVTVSVAADAAYGPRDVSFTQSLADGGDSAAASGATVVLAPVPSIASVTPSSIRQEQTGVVLTVTGSGFRSGGAIAVSGAGISLGATTVVDATTATVVLGVAADAVYGARNVTFTQPAAGGGDAAVAASAIVVSAPLPSLSAVAPSILRQEDEGVLVTVTGAGLRSGGTLSISGGGITVSEWTIVSGSTATLRADVASDATLGTRTVTYTQPAAGGGDTATLAAALRVGTPVPTVSGAAPTQLRQGASAVSFTVTGTRFRAGGTVAISGGGLTVSSTSVLSSTQARVTVSVAADAAFGPRDVSFTQSTADGGQSAVFSGAIQVIAPVPSVATVSPGTIRQEQTGVVLTVTGTGFRSGGTISVSGAGITLGATTVVDATTATVVLSAATDATYGARNVTFTQPAAGGGDTAVAASALVVQAPVPVLSTLSPATVRQEDVGALVTVTGAGLRSGGTISIAGSGITISEWTIVNASTATLRATVASNATLGTRSVTYSQPSAGGGDSVTLANSLRVNVPVPSVTGASPAQLRQGASSVDVTVTGTRFRAGGTVAISGSGMSVGSTTVLSSSQARVTVSVAADATFGARDVSFTQPLADGGDAAVAVGAISVLAPVPSIASVSPGEIRQEHTGLTLTVTGTGFRSGGTITVSGAGISYGATTVVDATTATVFLGVAADATYGARNVSFTQPAPGGGELAVAANAVVVRAPAPGISAVAPGNLSQNDSDVLVTVTATGLRTGGTFSISGTGITISDWTIVSSTSATFRAAVASDATLGARSVTYSQPASGGGELVTVADVIFVSAPDPVISAVTPAQVGQGSSGTLTLTGSGFRSGMSASTGAGVTLGSVAVISSGQATVSYSVSGSATLGARDITLTQSAQWGGATRTNASVYSVLPPEPTVTAVTPAAWLPGQSNVSVRITGTGFVSGTTVAASGSGVTIVNLSSGSPATEMLLRVAVASGAALGPRDLTIIPGATGGPRRTFTGPVTIAPADPDVLSFSHATLAQGGTASVVITGQNFRSGDTVTASGTGVTFSSVTVSGTGQLLATATVGTTASTGLRSLIVTHSASDGGRSGTLANAFRVVAAGPAVTSVSPPAVGVTGAGGATREVPVSVTGNNFATGAVVTFARTGASGVTVVTGTTAVVSDTRIDVTISLAGNAGIGAWNVVVTNPGSLGNSGSSGNNLLDVRASTTLAVNRVIASSGSAYGGERVTVEGSGFADGCAVDFGTIRASGTQVLDANTLVTTVPIPASASNTAPVAVGVKVTPSSGAPVTLANGYTYAKDDIGLVTLRSIPAQGATSVPRNLVSAVVVLSAPFNAATGLYGSTTGTDTFWYEVGGGFTPGGARGSGPGGRFLVFTRTSTSALPISSAGVYVLDIPTALRSLGGNAFRPTRLAPSLNHDQQTFTLGASTSDTTLPTLTSITPSNGSSNQDPMTPVTLLFSETLDPRLVSLTSIALLRSGTAVPATIALSDDLRTVTIVPQNELLPSTTYTVSITAALTDLCGNAITALTRTFTTSGATDTTKPAIDAIVIELLPATVDGSGTYVGTNGTAGQNFDLYLPRDGWSLDVAFSDGGGSGIDASTFSAKCNSAVGSNSANSELASYFTVSSTKASWRIPASLPVAAGGNTTFTFQVRDMAGNVATSRSVTMDIADRNGTAQNGGDLDPLDSRRTWVLRTDMDVFSATFASASTPTIRRGATTSVAANNVTDFEEALRLVGLGTPTMTSAAAITANGADLGTNAIVRRIATERLRELLNLRFRIAADGTHGPDSADVEFLLPGEQGALATMPSYSAANSSASGSPFSEISIGGTLGADASAYTTSSSIGNAWFDVRNRREEANLNTGSATDTGVFLLGALKLQVSSNSVFIARVSTPLVAIHGGTPVGEHASDDDVLAGTFVRASSTNTAFNARYDAIMDAVEAVALYASAIAAHEIGHSLGLVADGAPKTGAFGAAHYNNTFTEATSVAPNTARHLDFLGNDLMAGAASFDATVLTGSDFKRFSPMDIAYLLNRLLYDEGK